MLYSINPPTLLLITVTAIASLDGLSLLYNNNVDISTIKNIAGHAAY